MFSPPSPLPGKKACFLCYVWALWRSRTERGSFHRPSQQAELLKPFLPSKKIFFIAIFTLAWAWKQSNLTALYSCSRGERRGLALSTAPRGGSKPAAPTGDFEFSGPAELAPAGPGGPDPAVPAAGHRGAPKPHGWGGGAGAGPRGPAAAPPRGAAGRGRRGGPQRPVPRWSFSDLAERRPGGRAGAGERRELLTAPAAGVCRLPGRRFEACSCCPPPRRVASRRSRGARGRAAAALRCVWSLTWRQGGEKRHEIACLPWEVCHVSPRSSWVLPSVAIIPQGTAASRQFLLCVLVLMLLSKIPQKSERAFQSHIFEQSSFSSENGRRSVNSTPGSQGG